MLSLQLFIQSRVFQIKGSLFPLSEMHWKQLLTCGMGGEARSSDLSVTSWQNTPFKKTWRKPQREAVRCSAASEYRNRDKLAGAAERYWHTPKSRRMVLIGLLVQYLTCKSFCFSQQHHHQPGQETLKLKTTEHKSLHILPYNNLQLLAVSLASHPPAELVHF